MRKRFAILTLLSLLFVVSCAKISEDDLYQNGSNLEAGEFSDGTLNATDYNQWHYFSFSENKTLVSIEDESVENGTEDIYSDGELYATVARYDCSVPESVKERTDWDIAICRYKVRTNSGTSGVGQGGLYTFADGVTVSSIGTLSLDDIDFTEDEVTQSSGMTEVKYESISTASVAWWDTMPPVYYQPPLYLFRSGDGESYYAVQFTSYEGVDDKGQTASGYVSFEITEMNIN